MRVRESEKEMQRSDVTDILSSAAQQIKENIENNEFLLLTHIEQQVNFH